MFSRFGSKINYHGYKEKTILLKNIKDSNNKIICDHIWFNYTKGLQSIGDLEEGDMIIFEARVKLYVKGYVHKYWIDERSIDYKLSYPTKFRRSGD